jgi:hypothetical protein
MLAVALYDDEPLAKIGCNMQTDVHTFWGKVAERKPNAVENMKEVCAAIATALETEYGADNLEEMVGMVHESQLQKLMAGKGGKATWSGMIAYLLGQPLKGSAAHTSVALSTLSENVSKSTPVVKAPATWDIKPIGAAMVQAGTLLDDILPEYVFNAFSECEDPMRQQISNPDVSDILDEYTHYMITTHHQPAADMPLRKWHAKQLKARLPHLPEYGGKPGYLRKWLDLLGERKRNFSRTKEVRTHRSPHHAALPECPPRLNVRL